MVCNFCAKLFSGASLLQLVLLLVVPKGFVAAELSCSLIVGGCESALFVYGQEEQEETPKISNFAEE